MDLLRNRRRQNPWSLSTLRRFLDLVGRTKRCQGVYKGGQDTLIEIIVIIMLIVVMTVMIMMMIVFIK